jgi:dolichol-phosphate mannosyltransferase
VIHRASKLGLGSATIEAMRIAIDHGYKQLITMDSDLSHDPAHLPALMAASANADVAIGSRYCTGGAIKGWPLRRRALSRAMNALSRMLLRLPVRDSSGSYRVYRIQKLRDTDLAAIHSAGYAYLEEILWHLNKAGASFAEVPITFRNRRAGSSKMGFSEVLGKIQMLVQTPRHSGQSSSRR